ncbi:hypothetical protein, partial [Vibrio sp. 10N.222.49.B4]|uniref:hypothetical protein n=1 Tax=Vibrio sp. 10N.222.49.B4 TaxID=3229613 RepID=UPI00354E9EE9
RLLALSNQDAQLISDVLALTKKDTSLLNSLHQQAAQMTALKNDVSKAQYTAIASSENLLINPRGKINQANESDGVLTAGQYFCDGWKAGAAGAEVYRGADGFRLVSGSIVQLVPNIIDVGRMLRGNMDVVSGTPQIRINGGTDTATADSQKYIKFEVSGDGSKFTCLILAQSSSLPIYQQSADELTPCLPYLRKFYLSHGAYSDRIGTWLRGQVPHYIDMYSTPAITGKLTEVHGVLSNKIRITGRWLIQAGVVGEVYFQYAGILDARL